MSPELIFHIARSSEWRAALPTGEYRISTRDATLDEVGFIHCSYAHQVDRSARLVYADDDASDLVVLTIDLARVPAEIRHQNVGGGDEAFPHIYGPLPVAAVLDIVPVTVHRHRQACDAFASEAARYADALAR